MNYDKHLSITWYYMNDEGDCLDHEVETVELAADATIDTFIETLKKTMDSDIADLAAENPDVASVRVTIAIPKETFTMQVKSSKATTTLN